MGISDRTYLRWLLLAYIFLTAAPNSAKCHGVEKYEEGCYTDGSAILIKVTRGTRNYRFLLDTGSAMTLVDSARFSSQLQSHQLSLNDPKLIPLKDLPRFKNPQDFFVGGVFQIRSECLFHHSLEGVRAVAGEDIDGILGCDVLKDFLITIDSDKGRIAIAHKGSGYPGDKYKLLSDKLGRPLVSADLGGRADGRELPTFMLDTGAVGHVLILQTALYESLERTQQLRSIGASSAVRVDNVKRVRTGSVSYFRLWNMNRENIHVAETRVDEPNILGLSMLLQYNLALDFPNSTLSLQPRRTNGPQLDLEDCSGLGLLRESGQIVVRRVDPFSPAANAKVRLDDIVTSVDGVEAARLRMHPLRLSLSEEGKKVRLGLKRGAKEWFADLELADWRKPATEKDFE